MTETQWLTSASPRLMLDHVRSRASVRKLGLLAAAACRQVARHFDDAGMLPVVAAVERHAEGEGSFEEWAVVLRAAERYGIEAATTVGDSPAVAARLALRALVSSPTAAALEVVLMWAEACEVRTAEPGKYRSAVRTSCTAGAIFAIACRPALDVKLNASTASSKTARTFAYPGSTPGISASGT